jgi:hypothetical protein
MQTEIVGTREAPVVRARDPQRELGNEQTRPCGVTERPVVVMTPGNAGRAKGPWFNGNVRSGESQEIGVSLVTPETVEKLQTTLHAKA